MTKPQTLENYFAKYRANILGVDHKVEIGENNLPIMYADWTASGRLYEPIERLMLEEIYPLVANTHTETNYTGTSMTLAYNEAKKIIKRHVNACQEDILITSNSGMTGVVNKFQRILGLKLHERFAEKFTISKNEKPIIFVTHMEHHSNQTSWVETIGEVVIIQADNDGKVDLNHLKTLLDKYSDRSMKIAAITSCSNVTGIFTPYHDIATIMHESGGLCFVDFACSAPYIDIDMHPANYPQGYLDAIYFSPHKFLGGPGSNGVLIFNSKLYNNRIPDHPGGGTVDWTNPWGEHKYHEEIEAREDGGTPGFLQTIRIALAIKLKEQMGIDNIHSREQEINDLVFHRFEKMDRVQVFANHEKNRLPIFSFIIEGAHYNLVVKLLNDKFGVQVRGGCSCAGTYGHILLEVSYEKSKSLTNAIDFGDLSSKPGWIRISFHPTMTDQEVNYCLDAIEGVSKNHVEWSEAYQYNSKTNEFNLNQESRNEASIVHNWFTKELI